MPFLLVEEFHDIAPPVDYSLLPTWVIFLAIFAGLCLLGLIGWLIARRRKRAQPPPTAREHALRLLEKISGELETTPPYEFSIDVSDILRRYVTAQYRLPLTNQTSVEFLNSVAQVSKFSDSEKALLDDFLTRCDLIKFARYEATNADSRNLLDEATSFVKGGELEPA